jgi:hypothetical protein
MIYRKIIIPYFGGISKEQEGRLVKDTQCVTSEGIFPRIPGTLLSRRYQIAQPEEGCIFKDTSLTSTYWWRDRDVDPYLFEFTDRVTGAFGGAITGMYRFDPYIIIKCETELFDNFHIISGITLPSDSYLSCIDFSGTLYIAATPSVKKYNRNLGVSNWGIVAPTTAPTITDIAVAGNVNGTYYYKYTFLNSAGKESIASPMSAVISVVDSKTTISDIEVSSDSQVVSKNIYRFGGTSALFKLVANIPSGDGSYDDNLADEDLGVEYDADKHYAPSQLALKFCALHFGRVYAISDTIGQENWLWFSEAFEPEYFGRNTLENYLLVGGSDPITAILPMFRTMLVFKANEIYVCEGTVPEEMFITPTTSKHGCPAPFSPAMWKYAIFASWDGIYTFDGRSEEKLVDYTDPIFESTLDKTHIENCVGIVWRGFYFFSYPSESSSDGYPDTTLIFDLEHENNVFQYESGIGFTQFVIDADGELWGSTSSGEVLKLEQEGQDSDAEIPDTVSVVWESKNYHLGEQPGEVGGIREFLFTFKTGEDVA